jgi:tetratricopeptide (TPR) repeat protein
MMTMSESIGRDEQIERLRQQIEATIAGKSTQNVIFVTGEAGIGKTTILNRVREELARSGNLLVTMAECSTPLAGQDVGEIEALQPWASIMTQLVTVEGAERSDTRKLAANLAMAWIKFVPVVGDLVESVVSTTRIITEHRQKAIGDESSAASQQQVFQQFLNFLSSLSDRTPLALIIDDFHWADTSSANLLFAAARQLRNRPIAFVIAYRPDDAASSRNGEGHPILHVRNELERYELVAGVDVPKMASQDIDRLLRRRNAHYGNNDHFEDWLARISGGNALFITQFLRTLEEDGYIDADNGEIREGFETIDVPRSAYAVIEERIRRMNEESRELLRYASVEGDTFTVAVLGKIMEMPALKLLSRLRTIAETHRAVTSLGKRRVYASETTAYQFSHALLHRAMYESLEQEERELLHQAILGTLKDEWQEARASQMNISPLAARLAVHAEVLDEYLFAAEVMLAAARESWKTFAEQETLRQLGEGFRYIGLARSKGASDQKVSPIEADLYLRRGDVHKLRGRLDAAQEDYHLAQGLFKSIGREGDALKVEGIIAAILFDRGDYAEAEHAVQQLQSDSERAGFKTGVANAVTIQGHLHSVRGETDAARKCYERSMEMYAELDDIPGVGLMLNNIGVMCFRDGEFERALEAFQRSNQIKEERGDLPGQAAAVLWIGNVHFYLGDQVAALQHHERSMEIAEKIGDLRQQAFPLASSGVIYRRMGQLEKSRELLDRALLLTERIGMRELNTMLLGEVGLLEADEARALHGIQREQREAEAVSHIEECIRRLRDLGNADSAKWESELQNLKNEIGLPENPRTLN